ncbi:MAG: pyridoxamine 5'-phosphate oxidase family protein, partial [Persicimonas sp.]
MDRFEDLDELREHILGYIEAAVRHRDNAMTTPVFATDGPGARTVALRQFAPDQRALLFHTDMRSKKVEQLEDNPRAIWLAWDRSLSQQFRLVGPTTVHADDDIADALWESEPDEDLAFYYKTSPPGARAEKPTSGINTKVM